MEERIKRIFESLCKSAVSNFYAYDEVAPFIFIYPKDGDMVAIPISEDKEGLSLLTQMMCRKIGAIAGGVVSEAWMHKMEKGETWDGTLPSQRLDRVEILQVSIFSKVFTAMKAWRIVRDGNKKSLEVYEETEGMEIQSRFFGDCFRVDA